MKALLKRIQKPTTWYGAIKEWNYPNSNSIRSTSNLLILQFAPHCQSSNPTTMKSFHYAAIAIAAVASTAHVTMASCDSNSGLLEIGLFNILQVNANVYSKQCTKVDYASDFSVGFHTHIDLVETSTYQTDTKQYETFDVAELKVDAKLLSVITTIPTTLHHSYTSNGQLDSNVAIDLSIGTLDVSIPNIEIAVWTAVYGNCKPTSSTGRPINAQVLLIADIEFDLYLEDTSGQKTYVFVPMTPILRLDVDLKLFLDILLGLNIISNDHYLQKVQCSTSVAVGIVADLTVDTFSVKIQ